MISGTEIDERQGCGMGVVCNLPLLREEKEGCRLTLTVAHLRGGHSGVEIDKGRANANILMGRLLFRLQNELPLGIAEYYGGSRVNAIASHAEAEILIEKSRLTEYEEHIKQMEAIFRKEYHASDPDISVNLKLSESGCFSVLDEASAARMISLLLILPDGMQENFCSRHSKSGLCIHRSDDGGCSYSAGAFEHFFCTKNMESASYGSRRRKIFAIIQWAGSEKSVLPIHNDLLILYHLSFIIFLRVHKFETVSSGSMLTQRLPPFHSVQIRLRGAA